MAFFPREFYLFWNVLKTFYQLVGMQGSKMVECDVILDISRQLGEAQPQIMIVTV